MADHSTEDHDRMQAPTPGWAEPTISLFCDEVTADPVRQMEVMRDFGIAHIDLRSAWNTDLLDLDRERVAYLATLFADTEMRVVCLATRIGKRTSLRDAKAVEIALSRAFELAEIFDVRFVRIFGFLATPGEVPEPAALRRVTDCLAGFAASARSRGFTLLLECERGLVVDGPDQALEVLRTVDSPALRYIWDPGNMVDLGISSPTDRWFDQLVPYLGHVHVKDGALGSPSTCYPGAGDGQVAELLAALRARSYGGVISLEPNVGRLAEFDGDRTKAVGGALQALRALIPTAHGLERAS